MKLYKTNSYKSIDGEKDSIVFMVFNDVEREYFTTIHTQLLQVYKLRLNSHLLNKWNDFDREALHEILLWPQTYLNGGKMADLTSSQVGKIQKMVNKLFDDKIDFMKLFNLSLDNDWNDDTYMSDYEMRNEMDRRRRIEYKSSTEETAFSTLFDWNA